MWDGITTIVMMNGQMFCINSQESFERYMNYLKGNK